ncbi:MAG TPA: hypothetical protein VEU08_01615, partial [Vicinamibacterales bacterium]|nr:hypothetical protein [Vicinamibacterales bacterium]
MRIADCGLIGRFGDFGFWVLWLWVPWFSVLTTFAFPCSIDRGHEDPRQLIGLVDQPARDILTDDAGFRQYLEPQRALVCLPSALPIFMMKSRRDFGDTMPDSSTRFQSGSRQLAADDLCDKTRRQGGDEPNH